MMSNSGSNSMCYSPITLKTNTKYFTPYTRLYNVVPCGKCEQCQELKISDWQTRIFYEWHRCNENGGFSVMVTLTYKRSCLPNVTYCDKVLPCFSKTDIRRYIRQLRSALRKCLGLKSTDKTELFRYFQVSEYGGTYGRPHYHIIFHFYLPYKLRDLIFDCIQTSWYHKQYYRTPKLVSKQYTYKGRTRTIKYFQKYFIVHNGIVQISQREDTGEYRILDFSAIKYVAKYLHKDYFFDNTHNALIESLPDSKKKDFLFEHGPFALRSLSYGDFTDTLSEVQKTTCTCSILTNSGEKTKSLPLYIQRKIYYNVDKDKCFHLNELGVHYKVNTLDVQRVSLKKKIISVLSLFDNGYPSVLNDYLDVNLVQEDIDFLRSILEEYGYTFIINYGLIFFNRVIPRGYENSVLGFNYADILENSHNDDVINDFYRKLLEVDSERLNFWQTPWSFNRHKENYDFGFFESENVIDFEKAKDKYNSLSLHSVDSFFHVLYNLLPIAKYYNNIVTKTSYEIDRNIISKIKSIYKPKN